MVAGIVIVCKKYTRDLPMRVFLCNFALNSNGMSKLNPVWQFIKKNKYACIFLFFILLIGFLDENSFMHRLEMQSQISDLEQEIRSLRASNERDSIEIHRLQTDINAVRSVARTRYYMRRDGEDVFVFVDSTQQRINHVEEQS